MICATCIAARRPAKKGTPLPHFCDACGWALCGADRIKPHPEAALIVATDEVLRERVRGLDQEGRMEALKRAIEIVSDGQRGPRATREKGAE